MISTTLPRIRAYARLTPHPNPTEQERNTDRLLDLVQKTDEHIGTKKYLSETSEGLVENYRSVSASISEIRRAADGHTRRALNRHMDLFPYVNDINFVHSYITKKISKDESTYYGNCGEKTFHAYNHLLKRLDPQDRIAIVVVENIETGKNHCFIVLNSTVELNRPMLPRHPNYFLISNSLRDWGEHALIYDPVFQTIHRNNDDVLIPVHEKREVSKGTDTAVNTYQYLRPQDFEQSSKYRFVVALSNFEEGVTNQHVLRENVKKVVF